MPEGPSARRRRAVFISVLLATFLAAMDQTVVGTAMPQISAALGGMRHYAWVFTSYMLAVTVAVPIAGKLGDLFGRRALLLTGVVVLLLGSLSGGLATSMTALIAARAVQGIGAGVMTANAYAAVGDLYPPSQLGKYNGVLSGVYALASVIGPLLGGALTDTVGWRWTFFVNIPVALVVGVVLAAYLPRPAPRSPADPPIPLDWAGSALLIVALVPSLLTLSAWGDGRALADPWMLAGAGVALLGWIGFALAERRAREPVVSLELFRNRVFAVASLVILLSAAAIYGVAIYTPLYMQGVFGLSATGAGLVMTPMVFALVLGSVFAGVWVSRRGRYKGVIAVGLALAIPPLVLLGHVEPGGAIGQVYVWTGLFGLGAGLTVPTLVLVTQNAAPHRQLGIVTALGKFFRTLGGMIGIAVFGALVNVTLDRALSREFSGQRSRLTPAELSALRDPERLINRDVPRELSNLGEAEWTSLLDIVRGAFHDTVGVVFLACAGLALVACALTLVALRELPLRERIDDQEAP